MRVIAFSWVGGGMKEYTRIGNTMLLAGNKKLERLLNWTAVMLL